ncbi:MAG: hypothetical protein JMHAAFGB_01333 [Dehalococcoides mccartyi]|nr:hypothetical protein [Dehalococcoides mccartyi]
MGVFHSLLTGHAPLAGGGNNLQMGGKGVYAHIKTYLVIAFAGAAVGNGGSPFFQGYIYHNLGNQGAGKGGCQRIDTLVHSIGLDSLPDIILGKFLAYVPYVGLFSPYLQGLFFYQGKVFLITHVYGNGNNVHAVFFLKPFDGCRCIQPAGICQYNFFRHKNLP